MERLPIDPKGMIGMAKIGESAAPAESQYEIRLDTVLSNRWWHVEGMLRRELRKA